LTKHELRYGPMLKLAGAVTVVFLSLGCTKTAGVVTDVNAVPGGLLITKCDEIVWWDYVYLAMGQGNCRNEMIKR
jgi:hypothetical protein